MQQVVVHRNRRQPAHHPVAHQKAQRARRKRQGEQDSRNGQPQQRAAHHLPGLQSRLAALPCLHPENAQHPPGGKHAQQRCDPLPCHRFAFFRCRVALHQPDIQQCRPHAQRVYVQKVCQLVDHHIVFIQPPDAPPAEGERPRCHCHQGAKGIFHRPPRQQREDQIRLHLDCDGPGSHPDGSCNIGCRVKRLGKGQVHHNIPHHIGAVVVQVPGQRHGKQQRQRDKIIAGHNAHDAALVKLFCVRYRLSQQHGTGIGQEQQKARKQNRSVHWHIPGAQQIIQRVTANARRQPGLLPKVVPADDKHQQHPQAVQFRYFITVRAVWLHAIIPLIPTKFSLRQRAG